MSQSKHIPGKTQNAAQRISAVEKSLQALSENTSSILNQINKSTNEKINILADEVDKLSTSLKSISKRLNAVLETTETKDTVNKMMIEDAVRELKAKVEELVELGALERNDTLAITDKTFVVGREIDADGNEVNPRVQFATVSLPEELQTKLIGSKVGDLIKFDEGQPSFEVTEMYAVKEIKKDLEPEMAVEEQSIIEESTNEEEQNSSPE